MYVSKKIIFYIHKIIFPHGEHMLLGAELHFRLTKERVDLKCL
jgi:hypothetical protein